MDTKQGCGVGSGAYVVSLPTWVRVVEEKLGFEFNSWNLNELQRTIDPGGSCGSLVIRNPTQNY